MKFFFCLAWKSNGFNIKPCSMHRILLEALMAFCSSQYNPVKIFGLTSIEMNVPRPRCVQTFWRQCNYRNKRICVIFTVALDFFMHSNIVRPMYIHFVIELSGAKYYVMFRFFQLVLFINSYLRFAHCYVLKRIQFCLFWSMEIHCPSVAKSMFSFKFELLEDRKHSACYHSLKHQKSHWFVAQMAKDFLSCKRKYSETKIFYAEWILENVISHEEQLLFTANNRRFTMKTILSFAICIC